MKIRNGFVSNSSSSSFVVISDDKLLNFINNQKYDMDSVWKGQDIVIGPNDLFSSAKVQFGWETEKTFGAKSKIVWATLQGRTKHFDMLAKVICDVTKANSVSFDVDEVINNYDWYIDHQSMGQTEIFNDEDTLKSFLFDRSSYIQGGNDNG